MIHRPNELTTICLLIYTPLQSNPWNLLNELLSPRGQRIIFVRDHHERYISTKLLIYSVVYISRTIYLPLYVSY